MTEETKGSLLVIAIIIGMFAIWACFSVFRWI